MSSSRLHHWASSPFHVSRRFWISHHALPQNPLEEVSRAEHRSCATGRCRRLALFVESSHTRRACLPLYCAFRGRALDRTRKRKRERRCPCSLTLLPTNSAIPISPCTSQNWRYPLSGQGVMLDPSRSWAPTYRGTWAIRKRPPP